MAKYLRSVEMTQGGGFRCFLCGDFLDEWAIDPTGMLFEGHCAPCGMTIRLEMPDPVEPGLKAAEAIYRPLDKRGELRCLNCGKCLAPRLEGAFVSSHNCRICKSRVHVTVQPPPAAAIPSTGAPPSASDARISHPATPAFSGRST